ncbi:MAG: carboxypeptidase M32 [Bacteroidota bacterium]
MKHEGYTSFRQQMRKIADIEYAAAVLEWDKEVNLPQKGAPIRGQQTATLYGLAHEYFTAPTFGALLADLHQNGADLSAKERRNIELSLHDYQRKSCLASDFVVRRSALVSKGYHAWLAARKANDYSVFEPALADLVAIKREEAEQLGYAGHPYNALLQEFEPNTTTQELDVLFEDVKTQLIDFVKHLKQQPQVDDQFLHQPFDKDKQWAFGLEVLKRMGYDFQAGRQDLSPHPFTINFGPSDVRVTTRIDEQGFTSMTWSCIHEGGHALYEQGLPEADYGLPTGRYLSLGIHESQSRLWENNVGRMLPFWEANYSLLQEYFPKQLDGISVEQFVRAINKVSPSLIRIESDELHYHFHILIRYELEKALVEGSLSTKELGAAWNAKYKAYLGVDVPDDNQGVLQDIHWAHGSLGYFPTYSLGSFYAAQFYQQAEQDLPNLNAQIRAGDNTALLSWLRENIHQHGRYFTAQDLCTRITGSPLRFEQFMDYAKAKYSWVYGLSS